MAILSFSILRWNDPLKTKKGLQYCKPDSIIIDPAHTANTANLKEMMRMHMVQGKLHTLFFYKTNKYLLEKKFSCASSFLTRGTGPDVSRISQTDAFWKVCPGTSVDVQVVFL
jgi:hypothetical protein